MARSINKVILIGHLGGDPEVRYATSGEAIASVSLATSEVWKDREGEKQERTEWHRLKFFRRLAEIAGEHLKKGMLVYVEGKINSNKYTDREGVERISYGIVVDQLSMLSSKDGGGEHGRQRDSDNRPSSSGRPPQGSAPQQSFEDDDIPF